MALIGNPIVGDNKYEGDKVLADSGIEPKLHLHARRLVIPHPAAGTIDVTAPLPEHMRRAWELLGLDADRFDADQHTYQLDRIASARNKLDVPLPLTGRG